MKFYHIVHIGHDVLIVAIPIYRQEAMVKRLLNVSFLTIFFQLIPIQVMPDLFSSDEGNLYTRLFHPLSSATPGGFKLQSRGH